ncbi:NTE family protein RssA [Georgfuchsia toluolica]|uniref:NTE family protein RssA n=1 Tax=Georgfuchsia toluolica TaxID=424218 RepID=A0A916N895_9PROT|nr:patatin-like phospholipase family protein [Georgfuchsia toluolica]CAG4882336.1 NTE family protein RssA [Georgfuchsia toluolica]
MTPKLGLVLGSGSARGWAHIGVLRELAAAGYSPDIVCGCSIGAFVGAAYANGDLDKLEHWVRSLTWQEVLTLLDVSLIGGLIKGDKLIAFFERHFVDRNFPDLPLPFACVATDLATGHEVWLREGSVAAAVRASIALPGLFRPVARDGQLLVDGGLVNPVPVSLARTLGADVVIAVDLGSDIVGKALRKNGQNESFLSSLKQNLVQRFGLGELDELPSLVSVLTTSIHIMQTRIARSRLAGEPADVLLSPRLAHLALMDYHRANEAISEGRETVKRMLPAIQSVLPR